MSNGKRAKSNALVCLNRQSRSFFPFENARRVELTLLHSLSFFQRGTDKGFTIRTSGIFGGDEHLTPTEIMEKRFDLGCLFFILNQNS